MDQQQRGIINLIYSGITGEAVQLPADFDLEAAYPTILQHGVISPAYEGAVLCGIDKQLPVMKNLFQGYYQTYLHSERQLSALQTLYAAFEKEGLDYLPLKGCVLKKLYRKPELRPMGDADILIRDRQYDRIHTLMLELGYEEQERSEYDYKWDSKPLHLELHWRIVRPADKEFAAYFGDGWQRAIPESGSRYTYRPEDMFIHVFTHMVKHYRDSGVGLKHAADIWVCQKSLPAMDNAYIMQELDKLHLAEFFRNLQQMLKVWFEGAEEDEKSNFITQTIFASGAFGHHDTFLVSTMVRAAGTSGSAQTAKRRRIIQLLFPSCSSMAQPYPILQRAPFLLPFCWVHRWVRVGLFEREKYHHQQNHLAQTSSEQVDAYRQALHYVGLEFTE